VKPSIGTVMPPTLTQDQRYCVEIMTDGTLTQSEATNGAFAVDRRTREGPGTISPAPRPISRSVSPLSLFHHQEHSGGVMYDNVVVSKSHIGCQ
jgi:hypothetical protein